MDDRAGALLTQAMAFGAALAQTEALGTWAEEVLGDRAACIKEASDPDQRVAFGAGVAYGFFATARFLAGAGPQGERCIAALRELAVIFGQDSYLTREFEDLFGTPLV